MDGPARQGTGGRRSRGRGWREGPPDGSKPAQSPVERFAPVFISAGPLERRLGREPLIVTEVARGRFSIRGGPAWR